MTAPQRVVMMAEMHGRDLVRRRVALALLVALPLSFYLASAGSGDGAVATGGVGMAFAVAGAALFSELSSADVDQRLVLGGYRPFELLTADEHLIMFGRGVGLSREDALTRGHALLAEFDFPVARSVVTAHMSGGTRQKLNLALALLPDPAVLLLDEPYQGFDRGTYVNFWEHCKVWRAEGKAVVVVTHMLAELDRVDGVFELAAARGGEG